MKPVIRTETICQDSIAILTGKKNVTTVQADLYNIFYREI